jgi:hypothetical protein
LYLKQCQPPSRAAGSLDISSPVAPRKRKSRPVTQNVYPVHIRDRATFSPADTRQLLAGALHPLRDDPPDAVPRYILVPVTDPTTAESFRARQREIEEREARRVWAFFWLPDIEPDLNADPDDRIDPAVSPLGGIELHLRDLGLGRANDELGGHIPGFHFFQHRDTVRERRPTRNMDFERRDRGTARAVDKKDGGRSFSSAPPT